MTPDVLEQVDGRTVVRLERTFNHPVERVWDAITDPAQVVEWWCGMVEAEVDLREGGSYVIRWVPEVADEISARSPDEPLVTEDTILRLEPPHILEHTLDGSAETIVLWELSPDGDGTRLRVSHTVAPDKVGTAPEYLSGWGMCLIFMRRMLEGDPVGLPGKSLAEIVEIYEGAA